MIRLKEGVPTKVDLLLTDGSTPIDGEATFVIFDKKDEIIWSNDFTVEGGKGSISLPKIKDNDYMFSIETDAGYSDLKDIKVSKSARGGGQEVTRSIHIDLNNERVEENKDEVNEFFTKNGNRLKKIESDVEESKGKMDMDKGEMMESMSGHRKELDEKIESSSKEVKQQVEGVKSDLATFQDFSVSKFNELDGDIENVREELTNKIDGTNQTIDTINKAIGDISKNNEENGLSLSEKITRVEKKIPSGGILDYEVDDEGLSATILWSSEKIDKKIRGEVGRQKKYVSYQNMFDTIAVSGQDNLQPTTPLDELTIVAGTNMTITTDAETNTLTFDATGGGTVGPGTINEIAYFDTTTSIASLPVATYPSLTELSYVKGVTSAIQTQLNAFVNGMIYKGNWDASAGTFPGGGVAQTGWFYTVSVGGTVDSVVFNIGDRLIATTDNASATTYAGNWTQLDATDAVTSVNSQTGNVVLTTADVADSSNKRYVTDANLTVIGNTSGTNTGDQDLSGLMVKANNLSDLTNTTTARTNLGLGTLATQNGTFSGTSSGTNTGDQTTIVGITGTKAEFDTAVTDGNFLYVGDITQYTDELAQDAVGAMIDASMNYVDGTPLLQRAALTGAITATAGSNTTSLGTFTTSQLNTALSDNDIATGGGTATGTNTGDQTTIVGITGTKAQFDTAVSDGNILYVGDITQYTDELAQDAVGAMIDSSLTYVDGTPLLQRAALTGAITASAGSNTTALGSFTTADFNTALSDNNIATGGGTATGTNTGDQNLFSTISVSGQSNVVADSTGDTLTLVAGTNVTITTDASTDSITVNASGGSGSPGGSDGQIQYNNGGSFGGIPEMTWDDTTKQFALVTALDGSLINLLCQNTAEDQYSAVSMAENSFYFATQTATNIIACSMDDTGLYFTSTAGVGFNSGTGTYDFGESTGTYNGILDFDDITANRTFTFPNTSGTVALTSNIPTLGTGVATALGINVGSAGAFVTFNGALGTPSSGTLTNATGLPIAGLVASTSTALGVGSIELGHASDTTISRVSAGNIAVEGVNVVTTSSTDVLTNKTILGSLPIAGTSSSPASLSLAEDTDNGTNKVIIQAPATLSADYTLTLPTDDGTANQVLTTDGSGVLSWTGGSFKGCRVKKSGSQSLTGTGLSTVNFDAETFDTDTMHDNATNNTRITFTTAGYYSVTAIINSDVNAVAYGGIRLDGTTYIGKAGIGNSGTSTANGVTITVIYNFSANSYVEVLASFGTAGATACKLGEDGCLFMAHKIG